MHLSELIPTIYSLLLSKWSLRFDRLNCVEDVKLICDCLISVGKFAYVGQHIVLLANATQSSRYPTELNI